MFQKTEFTKGWAGQILHRNPGNRVGCCFAVEPDLVTASKLRGNVRADQKLSESRETRMSNWAVISLAGLRALRAMPGWPGQPVFPTPGRGRDASDFGEDRQDVHISFSWPGSLLK